MNKEEFFTTLRGLDLADGNLADDDALAVIEVAKKAARPKCNFLEIGSWKGKSSICLAVIVARHKGLLTCIDHFKGARETKEETSAVSVDIFNIFKNNLKLANAWPSLVIPIVAPFEIAHSILPNEFFDFVYIDADNHYSAMRCVINTYWRKLKPKGIMCGRNLLYDYESMKVEVDETIQEEYSSKYMLHPGIIKAVHDEFRGKYDRIPNSSVWYKKKS